MIKTETFEIPIYRGTITLYYTDDLNIIAKKYNKKRDLSNYGAVTFHKPKDKYKNYICAFECIDYSLIAHEVIHLVNYLYNDCGMKLDSKNDEHQAYITGWMFEQIESFLNKFLDSL